MSNSSLPTKFKIVQLLQPTTTNASITSDAISLKGAIKATIICHYTQAVGHATTPTLKQATDVAIGTNAAGPTSRIWANEDVATSDALVAQTAGASFAMAADVKNKIVVFEIDPATLTDGYDCVYLTQATSSQATNFCSMEAIIQTNFQQTSIPSAIVD
jgi:hypothetical protein